MNRGRQVRLSPKSAVCQLSETTCGPDCYSLSPHPAWVSASHPHPTKRRSSFLFSEKNLRPPGHNKVRHHQSFFQHPGTQELSEHVANTKRAGQLSGLLSGLLLDQVKKFGEQVTKNLLKVQIMVKIRLAQTVPPPSPRDRESLCNVTPAAWNLHCRPGWP